MKNNAQRKIAPALALTENQSPDGRIFNVNVASTKCLKGSEEPLLYDEMKTPKNGPVLRWIDWARI